MTLCVKKRVMFIVVLFGLLFLWIPCRSFASDVTVKLVWKFPDAGWLEVEARQGSYHLQYNDRDIVLPAGKSFKVGQSGMFPFLIMDNDLKILDNFEIKITTTQNGIFRVREPGKDWVSYRGNLTVTREGISWSLANSLDQELYLKGVVPIEMSNAWAAKGFEALKAQAVAARTYLLKNMNASRVITDSPNIHQAYLGRSVEGAASFAVEETSGQILVDMKTGEPISVYYSAHNGGYTEETQNVWKGHDPHYSSFPDPFSIGIGGMVDQWRFSIAADTLGRAFGLAPIRNIQVEKLVSGRVFRVHLEDWLGNNKTVTGGEFVQKFYPYDRSITATSFLGRLYEVRMILSGVDHIGRFQIINPARKYLTETSGPLLAKLISSDEGVAEYPRSYNVFVFNGRGWGHGVGMSQWGAYNMAMKGYSYEDILLYYYRNALLQF